jgi:hypothetical protein
MGSAPCTRAAARAPANPETEPGTHSVSSRGAARWPCAAHQARRKLIAQLQDDGARYAGFDWRIAWRQRQQRCAGHGRGCSCAPETEPARKASATRCGMLQKRHDCAVVAEGGGHRRMQRPTALSTAQYTYDASCSARGEAALDEQMATAARSVLGGLSGAPAARDRTSRAA